MFLLLGSLKSLMKSNFAKVYSSVTLEGYNLEIKYSLKNKDFVVIRMTKAKNKYT